MSHPARTTSLPYAPRQRRRPERPLPAPPPEEDVPAQNAFEIVQGYTSPPSPPKNPPPPLVIEDDVVALSEQVASTNVGGGEGRAPPPPPSSAQTAAQHINPFHSTLPSNEFTPPTILTPLRAHYLKKSLVNQQIHYELGVMTDPRLGANALGLLGKPFLLPESAKSEVAAVAGTDGNSAGPQIGDLPFLRFMFHQFLLPFPFLAAAPPTFWSHKVQPFLSSFLATTAASQHATETPQEREVSESLMTKEERKEAEERRKLWTKVEKHLGLMISVGIKLVGGEEVVRIGQSELRRIEEAQEARRRKMAERDGVPVEPITFDVNVVGVRTIKERGHVRSKHHEEFIIRTQRSGVNDVYVSRRYGDFRRLAEEIRIHFPDIPLANPPAKDKTVTTAAPVQQAGYGYYNPLRMIYGSGTATPTDPPKSGTSSPRPSIDDSGLATPVPLSREKNRLTLRAYLQNILSMPEVANSPIMRSFLLSSPITLTPSEMADVQRRTEADAVREEGRRRFREEAERRVEKLREGLAQFKGDILTREGGLMGVFEVVRKVEFVGDLPPAERAVLEWGRISLAATIFQLYVASDTASEAFAGLKRMHAIMPYFMLKGILKISNPIAMIRGVLDLFLARPFGGQSLLQRMFSQSLTEDVRYLAEDIQAVQDKIDDPVLCQKIEQYVLAPFEIQEIFRGDAVAENVDLLVVILRSPDMPALSRPQMQRVFRASRAYREYKTWQAELSDSDDDDGPDNDDAWLFEDLNILMKLMSRKKEKEAMISLIFEGVTAELLKDIITIFYSPLAQVYKAASIADSLGDLQAFINDMIRTVEQVEELSQEDPQRTVQTFIDLVQRHEQAFYTFVHNVHSKGQGLFESLMGWIELFLSYARDGLPSELDLEILLPHAGPERVAIMKEVDDIAQYHYKLKVAHEEKVRKRFAGGAGADQQTMEEAALVDSVLQSLSIGETIMGSAGEIAVEESEESEEEDDDHSDERSDTSSMRSTGFGITSPHKVNHGHSSLVPPEDARMLDERRRSLRNSLEVVRDKARSHSRSSSVAGSHSGDPPPPPPKDKRKQPGPRRKRQKGRRPELIAPPETPHLTELRPLFVEVVKQLLVVKPLTSQ
ncbi:hypothetical protein CcaverHIS002_0704850 [Cutaneotrichosporon cavernicola]|uniref:PX domain-containing protein n=1 Tax=Cutaneotrichosporon cavernicola TaxID=279322 RepID=A0AA48L9Y3_9TREE|nr:uncharacterized protein CcaverHIS019_0704920 [Cutaneotrichosporon cavernicola]BEI87139.1 hypothetical protein CcaverHIS002_0704850 [Cutaneotrichosporon cavernicola]BEI94911.1 hypothetical protein CcaverHIS019_0704920 [Cutaneotrichosporon cavernicola]BEJ02685.1 hypothetical protein CcaverHIS631_0704800 [Cutaneotrichosporon cavernicola]BEJ10441.1 hypothetical protein CcaverHIS641_0704760 [Cutaneotrichosporon cavernicola]